MHVLPIVERQPMATPHLVVDMTPGSLPGHYDSTVGLVDGSPNDTALPYWLPNAGTADLERELRKWSALYGNVPIFFRTIEPTVLATLKARIE